MYSGYPNRQDTGSDSTFIKIIKEAVKEEIENELYARERYNLKPGDYHWETDVSREESHGGLHSKWEGYHVPDMDDSHVRNVVRILLNEPGIVHYLNQTLNNENPGVSPGRNSDSHQVREKGILYGVGTAAFLGILFPTYGRKFQSVFTRTALEGAELFKKARSILARAKEDMEDLIAEANLMEQAKKRRE